MNSLLTIQICGKEKTYISCCCYFGWSFWASVRKRECQRAKKNSKRNKKSIILCKFALQTFLKQQLLLNREKALLVINREVFVTSIWKAFFYIRKSKMQLITITFIFYLGTIFNNLKFLDAFKISSLLSRNITTTKIFIRFNQYKWSKF